MSKNEDITIYFDMDGVLADVWGYLKKHNIVDGPLAARGKEAEAKVWDSINKVEHFYYQLEPIPGGLELFEDLNKDYYCEIITALPAPCWGMVGAAEDKRAWVAKYLGENVPVNIASREEKKNFAKNTNCILIDDVPINIEEWSEHGGIGFLFKNAESFDKSLISYSSAEQLRMLCITRAKEIYGETLPARIEERINEELAQIESADGNVTKTFLVAAKMFSAPCFKGGNRYTRGFRRALGASLVAYLCDITPFNPMELPEELTMHSFIFYNKKCSPLYINIGRQAEMAFRKSHPDYAILAELQLYNTPNLDLLEELQNRTQDFYICDGHEEWDDENADNMWELLHTDDIKFLPVFRDNVLAKQIIGKVEHLNIAAVTKVMGLMHGSGTWMNNAECLADKYDDWIKKAISSEEDVFEYLIAHQVPYTCAQDITEKVRSGDKCLSEEDFDILRKYQCEEWFIESVGKIRYLFSRAQTLCYILETKSLIYYLKKYRRLYIKNFEDVYGVKASRWAEWKVRENNEHNKR